MKTPRVTPRETRVAPNIWRTAYGWRVYVRRGGVRKPVRFRREVTLEELIVFRDTFNEETERLRRARQVQATERAGTLAGDADRYLALATTRAMPSYADRVRHMRWWVKAFGRRPRSTITARDIDEQLQALLDKGKGPSTVNKYRTALMAFYTRLEGRAGANPVRETRVYEEPPAQARGLPYDLVRELLAAMPAERSTPIAGVKGSHRRGNKTRARLEVMAWTGMTPAQIRLLVPRTHLNFTERWYVSPPRHKGRRRPRHPKPVIKKPMTTEAAAAFRRLVALKAYGPFSARVLRRTLERARVKVEKARRATRHDPTYTIPHIRPYDFRHSFGTALFGATGNLPLVAEMLDQTTLAMTKRYALGAVSDVLRGGMSQFEAATAPRRDRPSPGPSTKNRRRLA